jgi:excisionase family DNA binding protein
VQDIEPMLLDKTGAARALTVSKRQVMRFVASGELTPTRLGPRLVRFTPAELQAFIASRSAVKPSPAWPEVARKRRSL